ncbi:cation:proton antiporter [Longimicrobium terrae]|uniref:NhaP-type Na+/H+ or K+/H+ antiporter n=1 Tax=Longimicrobium terrae TaxID=1639882 RepID=A0A841H213_9BACT|nr:sodium:proton antiporter [Longimicrobium terrae]MBB4637579.1 NhaP-type Na+/H+ or K+/H+ antiporter [Longimicrobium terrae]MBB6071976.1 NhaP-type Na+/H+ or K+/H+ antiporter [Longimicrobium terrae]NNC30521.1 sodium:proton antiporter [Longimicrobium terrae]
MKGAIWFVLIGVLLVAMALSRSVLRRLPLSTSMLYLGAGFVLGPQVAGLMHVDIYTQSAIWERVTEVAVLISLFAAGLKLRTPLRDGRWVLPVRLATVSMLVTVGLVTLVGVFGMGLPVGAAVLLGGILAPTDPVLASDVQVTHPTDGDRLRFGLTGEAGLNDGTAFPFIMLGLGLLGLHDLGEFGWRWFAVDLVWAVGSGLVVGTVLGTLIGRLVLHLRRKHREAVGLDDFLALGLIALAYGVALLVHGYGFLAVFAAGLALRRIERREAGGEEPPQDVAVAATSAEAEDAATDKDKAPAYMAQAALGFTEQLERIGEFAVVLLLGGMISWNFLPSVALWFIPLLFLVIRPVSVYLGLLGSATTSMQRGLIAWFGIRGIGSVYYLTYAMQHGLPEQFSRTVAALVLATVAVSAVAHGISVTPLMARYANRSRREADRMGVTRSALDRRK